MSAHFRVACVPRAGKVQAHALNLSKRRRYEVSSTTMPGFTADAALCEVDGHYWQGSADDLAGNHAVLPQLRNKDNWTTDRICKACGCTVNGFICDCGLRPRPDKLACIRNGGPGRAIAVLG